MTKSVTISGGALFNYIATREELLRRATIFSRAARRLAQAAH